MEKFLFLSVIAVLAFATDSVAQKQRKSPHDTVSVKNIHVTYGRPYKKGREIFGALEKFGTVWRVGADEATEITFDKDATFGGKPVKAGTYTLFAKLGEKEWTIILNSELKQWGSFGYEKIKDKDVLQVAVPVKKLDKVVEELTISFTKKNALVIEWDQTQVEVPIKI